MKNRYKVLLEFEYEEDPEGAYHEGITHTEYIEAIKLHLERDGLRSSNLWGVKFNKIKVSKINDERDL